MMNGNDEANSSASDWKVQLAFFADIKEQMFSKLDTYILNIKKKTNKNQNNKNQAEKVLVLGTGAQELAAVATGVASQGKGQGVSCAVWATPKGPSAGQLLRHICGISERTFKKGHKKPGGERD